MKRILALLLCLALCLGTAFAAEKYDSEPEKMALQFLNGSGIKGSVVFHADGGAEWAQKLAMVSDVELQLRAIDNPGSKGYQLRLYVSDEGRTAAMTDIFSDGGDTAWLQSDFLMGSTYAFPMAGNLLTGLTSIGHENPSWFTVAPRMLLQVSDESWRDTWDPELEPIYQQIDLWLTPYATEPQILEIGGEKRMMIRYVVPAAVIKQEMKALLPLLLGNQRLNKEIHTLMTNTQAELYLHQGYTWYYEQLIDEMALEGEVVLERQFSTLGDGYSMLLTFPMANNMYGIKELTFMQEENTRTLSLLMADKTILLTATPDSDGLVMGTLRVYNENGRKLSVGYELSFELKKYQDDKERNNEEYRWTLHAQPELSFLAADDPARGDYEQFEPIAAEVLAHFYSKSGDKTAATLLLDCKVDSNGSAASMNATIKSASPWHVPEAPEGKVVDLQQLTDAQRSELFQDWLNNALLGISALRPEKEPEPEAQPAEEPAEDAAAEPAEEPAKAEEEPAEKPAEPEEEPAEEPAEPKESDADAALDFELAPAVDVDAAASENTPEAPDDDLTIEESMAEPVEVP